MELRVSRTSALSISCALAASALVASTASTTSAAPARASGTKPAAITKALTDLYSDSSAPLPPFAWLPASAGLPPEREAMQDPMSVNPEPIDPVVAFSADGTTAWIAADLSYTSICGMGDCAKMARDVRRQRGFHVTAVFDGGKALVAHLATTISDKDLAARVDTSDPDALPRKIDAGADDAVKLFEASLADAKALAQTVSDRADVVLLGSDGHERVVGGKQVRATLTRWGLSFKVRDGVIAGVNGSRSVAWVAANVDARGKKDKRATPYRALFVYEKLASGWQLVQLHFSFA